MPSKHRAPIAAAASPQRRQWLAGALLALVAAPAVAAVAESAPAGAAPRLRFRTRRAACACEGDIDDEAIERAIEERKAAGLHSAPARPASAAADGRDDKSAAKPAPALSNTRRPSP